jgi:hypothetical protein
LILRRFACFALNPDFRTDREALSTMAREVKGIAMRKRLDKRGEARGSHAEPGERVLVAGEGVRSC